MGRIIYEYTKKEKYYIGGINIITAIIPPYLIDPNKTAGNNIIKFIIAHGERHRIDRTRPAVINIDGIHMDFEEAQRFLATKDMKIKITQS